MTQREQWTDYHHMPVSDLPDYIRGALRSFDSDPADTDFQRGYKAAMEEIAKVFNIKVE